jgi:glycosyltransferase involved in cell wall biosynthesis
LIGLKESKTLEIVSKICVIIPAYNAAGTISHVVRGALKYIPRVMVADDGSTDDTAMIAAEAGAEVISIDKNRGKGHALKLLFHRAVDEGYDAVISMDADKQHNPEDIPFFMKAHFKNPTDIILGSRIHEKEKIPRARYNSMHIARFFVSLAANQFIEDTQCGFRLYPLTLLKKISLTTDRYVTETEILIKAGDMGYKIRTVKIRALYGAYTSHFRPVLDVDAITAYVISYLMIKWIKEGVSDSPNTYSANNIRDVIGRHKFINGRFQTLTALTIFPMTVLFLIEFQFFPIIKRNNFSSIRKLNCGFFKITLATHMLPVLLIIATVERIINFIGFRAKFTDWFIKIFYPDLWGEKKK